MKKLFFLIITFWISSVAFSQVPPEAFMAMLPAIPSGVCTMKLAERQLYLSKVDSILKIIEQERSRLNEKRIANSNEKQPGRNIMEDQIAQQNGLSEEDMQKLKSGYVMTPEEKKAMSDKVLGKSINMSKDELDKLGKMSEAGRKAHDEGYTTELMANAQLDAKKIQDQQLQNKSVNDLNIMQKHIIDSLTAIESKFAQQVAENNASGKIMLDNITKWEHDLISLIGNNSNGKSEELTKKIKLEKKAYCSKLTPGNLDIIKRYESYTKSCIPVGYRLEKIMDQLIKLNGVDLKQQPGQVAIGMVLSYTGKLLGAFQYNLLGSE